MDRARDPVAVLAVGEPAGDMDPLKKRLRPRLVRERGAPSAQVPAVPVDEVVDRLADGWRQLAEVGQGACGAATGGLGDGTEVFGGRPYTRPLWAA